jgi:uncharacterized repeat protein (TIGR03803 family)
MKLKNIGLAVGLGWLLGITLPAGAQVFTTQHIFTNTPDGANPKQLAWTNGFFYGTTVNGGTNGTGSIYQFNTNGPVFTTVYNFTGAADSGRSPNNLLVTSNMIYGTTEFGGTNGLGMIFAVNTNGTGFTSLYSFGPTPDGFYPAAGLILSGAALYGTAQTGGTNGYGAVFSINTNGTGYAILHSFTNTPDGYSPQSVLVLSGSTLFGTTAYGGTNGYGTIFALNTNGGGYMILRSFTNAPDAQYPNGGLVLDSGVVYGTATGGGSNHTGTIFAINTDGSGYRILHHFTSLGTNTDGSVPKATLTFNNGFLYGAASSGGPGNGGTLFEINTNGTGFAVIKSFTNNPASGSDPESGVILLGNTIWGTTYSGGPGNNGILYSLLLSPVITLQPQSVTVTNGNPATFNVIATDDVVTNYQWYFNTNTFLAGQTSSSLNFASATTNNAGTYTVVVSDNFGSITSGPAVLTVVSKPVITLQPQSISATNGNPASFTVTATGDGVLYYQWYFNTNTLLGGQTSNSLNFASITTNNAGTYTVVVSNYIGTVTSSPAVLTVVIAAVKPTITQQPQNYTVTNGYSASFTNAASGTAPLYWQWYFNTNTPVAGGTNSILLITFAGTNNAGYYSVIVTNAAGAATSSPALLTVISTKPIIFTQPQALTVTNGDTASFTVLAAGQSLLRYQWYSNSVSTAIGTLLAGKTNSTYSFTSITNSNGRFYSVVITNTLGKATSSPAMLTVISKPVIATNPQPQTVNVGATATFSVTALGANLRFQWYSNSVNTAIGTLLAGQTNSTCSFTAATNHNGRYYSVVVTNTFGMATSSPPALLTVQLAPSQPKFLNFSFIPASSSFSLTVTNTPSSANRLWASTNLTATNFWGVIASNTMAANGLWLFTDTNVVKTNRTRFYRASSP